MLPAEVRQRVALRAGRACEYCLLHEADAAFSHEVDHIISRKHGGTDDDDNLAYACFLCNRYKGSDIASLHPSGELAAFYHPRRQRWLDHFRRNGAYLVPLTRAAEVTTRIFQLNSPERLLERTILLEAGRYPGRVS